MSIIQKYFEQLHLEELGVDIISKAVSLILLSIGFTIFRHLLNLVFEKTVSKSLTLTRQSPARQKTIFRLLHNVLNYTLYFFLLYWVLSILGVPISSLLAGAGIAGLAIGLGAQGFLSDVVNGFFILIENQFEVGDSVVLDSVTGTVSSLGLRTTQVRDFDGTLHFIPNRSISVVSNKSRGEMRARIDLPIFAHTDLEQVSRIIRQVNQEQLDNYPDLVGSPNIIGPVNTTSGQLLFRIDLFVQNGRQTKAAAHFYQLYQEALLKEKILLATPTTNTVTTTS